MVVTAALRSQAAGPRPGFGRASASAPTARATASTVEAGSQGLCLRVCAVLGTSQQLVFEGTGEESRDGSVIVHASVCS